jgi:hypothetical protein
MRVVALTFALLLAACGESGFEAAQREYDFQKKNGASEADLCAAAKKVATAAMDANNSGDYKLWSVTSDTHCLAAGAPEIFTTNEMEAASAKADEFERRASGE